MEFFKNGEGDMSGAGKMGEDGEMDETGTRKGFSTFRNEAQERILQASFRLWYSSGEEVRNICT